MGEVIEELDDLPQALEVEQVLSGRPGQTLRR